MKSTILSLTVAATMTAAANPPAFILAGDSTTAVQSTGGGGWGNGFISFLNSPAWGVNKGHNGATTKSFVDGGDWSVVTGLVSESIASYDTYVTIQFGHNDQKNTSGLTLEQYQTNLVNLANEIWELGATPILLTPLTRRNFASAHNATDSLASERVATIAAASASNTTYLDLNAASLSYINSIGEATAHTYNLYPDDNTHLNSWGSIVFGRIVADLLLEEKPALAAWISANETMSELIRDGLPA